MTPKRLAEIRKRFKLKNPQLAALARVPVQPAVKPNKDNWEGARSAVSTSVTNWLSGKLPIPDSIGELLETKVWLLENSNTSVQTLLDHDLPYVLALFKSKQKGK